MKRILVTHYGGPEELRALEEECPEPRAGEARLHGIAIFALCIAGGWLFPGRKRVVPCSIQWLKRLKPELFRQDLIALLGSPAPAADQAADCAALSSYPGATGT